MFNPEFINIPRQNATIQYGTGTKCKGPATLGRGIEYRTKVLATVNTYSNRKGPLHTEIYAQVTVDERPYFTFTTWEHDAIRPRMRAWRTTPCWPKAKAPLDPGVVLLDYDLWNKRKWGNTPQHKQNNPYMKNDGYKKIP